MKKLAGFLMLLSTTPALGQAYQHPDWTDGSVPVRDWVNYSTTPPVGSAPADAYEPADVPDSGFVESDWILNISGTYFDGTKGERKFRVTVKPSTAKQIDPILGFGVFPFGHRHQGSGNSDWDQNSTWTSLRASPGGTSAGGPLNGTIYIEPEMLQVLGSGYARGIRPAVEDFYYVDLSSAGTTSGLTWLRRGIKFILGVNPKDFNDSARRAEYAAARFAYPGGTDTPSGFMGWQCFRPDGTPATINDLDKRTNSSGIKINYAKYLRGPGGRDPWGGTCTNGGSGTVTIIGNLVAPDCWDGHNLTAPDGRGHFAYSASKADSSVVNACPSMLVNGVRQYYMKVPTFTVKTEFRSTDFSDYGTWFLASDRMHQATTDCPDAASACPASMDPCRKISLDYCNGATLHADWVNGWKSSIIDEWERECIGITVRGVAPVNGPSGCDGGTISRTRQLRSGGSSPNPLLSGGCATILGCNDTTPGTGANRFNPVMPGQKGPFNIHGH